MWAHFVSTIAAGSFDTHIVRLILGYNLSIVVWKW